MVFSRLNRFPVLCSLYFLPALLFSLPGPGPQLSSTAMHARAAIKQNRIGVGYMDRQDFKEAAVAFQKALSEDRSFNLARVNLGIALFYDQELERAMAVLKEAERIEPLNPYVQFVIGLIHRNRGEVANAIERFSKVAGIDGRCAATHYNLGLLYSRQHRDREAEAELRRVITLDPDHAAATYNLGGLLVKSGRAEEGTRLLDRFRVLSQKDRPSSGMGSGSQYGKIGRYAIATDHQPPPAPGRMPAIP